MKLMHSDVTKGISKDDQRDRGETGEREGRSVKRVVMNQCQFLAKEREEDPETDLPLVVLR